MSCNILGNHWHGSNDIAKLEKRKHDLSAELHEDLRHGVFYADI